MFNMGIGMVLLVDRERVRRVTDILTARGQPHDVIGTVVAGHGRVVVESS